MSSAEIAKDLHSTNEHQHEIVEDNKVAQWYDQIAKMYPDTPELQFMNYGYADLDEPMDADPSQHSVKLYDQVR
jgi:hypothetical protein